MDGVIQRVDREHGHFRAVLQDGSDSYFAHFNEVQNMAHQCLIEDGLIITFTLGHSPRAKWRHEAKNILVVDAPSIPTELQVEAVLDYWHPVHNYGFAKLVSCGCRVFIKREEILTDEAYHNHLVVGARLILNTHRERDQANRGAFSLVGKRVEILVPEGGK
jgi:hypothetical protein